MSRSRSTATATATAVGRAYVHDMLLAPRPRCPGSTTAIGTSRYAIPTISAMPRDAIEIQALKSDSFGRISLMRDAGGVFVRRDMRHVPWWLWLPADRQSVVWGKRVSVVVNLG